MTAALLSNRQKAAAAFVVTLLTSAATAMLTAVQAAGESATLADLSTASWLTVTVSVLASTGLVTGTVYRVENRPTDLPT